MLRAITAVTSSGVLKSELPGILAWMLEGCADWLEPGLAPPDFVTQATAEYLQDEDAVCSLDQRLRSARDDESTVKRAPDGKWLTSGNPAGRPVGSRNKFADNFFADLTAAWTARGKTAMEKTAQDEPAKFRPS